MSTKTMRPPSRRVPCASANASPDSSGSKRKEREYGFLRPKPLPTGPMNKLLGPDKPRSGPEPSKKGSSPMPCPQLLAGYLAHEFLTKGTVLGRRMGHPLSLQKESQKRKYERYMELALLLKTDGPKLFDAVNPSQLARFLKL